MPPPLPRITPAIPTLVAPFHRPGWFVDLARRRGVTWLEPKVAVEVQYNDLTGGQLRAPVRRGIVNPGGTL